MGVLVLVVLCLLAFILVWFEFVFLLGFVWFYLVCVVCLFGVVFGFVCFVLLRFTWCFVAWFRLVCFWILCLYLMFDAVVILLFCLLCLCFWFCLLLVLCLRWV